jgi:hypothetical protein
MRSIQKSLSRLAALGAMTILFAAAMSYGAIDTIRVNSGGSAYTDAAGHQWAADSGFSGGQTYSANSSIANTADPTLHQNERWDSSPFTYTFNVKPGNYVVRLYEASLYAAVCNSGGRRFNVAINGVQVMTDYDMYDEIGACLTAQIKAFATTAPAGTITVEFSPGSAGNPKINAIEVLPGTNVSISDAPVVLSPKFSVSSANRGLLVQVQAEGAYSLELTNLQGQRVARKAGVGAGTQSFKNLQPGLYFMTTRVGHETTKHTVSVVR